MNKINVKLNKSHNYKTKKMNKIMRLSGFQLACSGSAHKASALPLGPRRLRPQEEEE